MSELASTSHTLDRNSWTSCQNRSRTPRKRECRLVCTMKTDGLAVLPGVLLLKAKRITEQSIYSSPHTDMVNIPRGGCILSDLIIFLTDGRVQNRSQRQCKSFS